MKPADFIAAIAPAAQECMAKTKIPASFTVAQAALESSWGAKAPGFNLFGIKADASWHGDVEIVHTHEFIHGVKTPVEDRFRAYSSWEESLEDHAHFLTDNERYASAFEHCNDGEAFARAIAAAGYATDPLYADKLCLIIRAHGLDRLDSA